MCGVIGSVVTLSIGAILVVVSCIITFVAVPGIIDNIIINSVVLIEDTLQMERFEQVPFALNFSITVFNISNANDVLNGGVAVVNEFGPYVYRLYQSRNITELEEDVVTYRKLDYFEFDAEASYPYTEDDIVTVINVPYHAILQIAERNFPQLVSILPLALNGVFGRYNTPIMNVRVGDLLKDKVPMCTNPGILGSVVCAAIREMASTAANIEVNDDGSASFSVLANKHDIPSPEYEVYRGLNDPSDLGRIRLFDGLPYFNYWTDKMNDANEVIKSRCNDVNGTDAGIFPPFLNRTSIVYAINTDICRSVELRYQRDVDFEGIPTYRYSANEWFLDNDDGCFCLNVTTGITQENGCLLKGAMELFSCVVFIAFIPWDPENCNVHENFQYSGNNKYYYLKLAVACGFARVEFILFIKSFHITTILSIIQMFVQTGGYMVLSYPHFLYADLTYKNGILGMRPIEDDHRIFMDIEPMTGTPVVGAKRGQFNIFSRPVTGIAATQNLRLTLMPIFWIEEGYRLPTDYVAELKDRMLRPLNLINILLPTFVAVCCVVFIVGIVITVRATSKKLTMPTTGLQ